MEYEGLQGASLGERANRLTAAAFDEVHAATAKSTLLRELAVLAYGDEYPAEVAPTGMTTWWILGRRVAGLRVGPRERLVDLACGSGGPGLWLARAAGADLWLLIGHRSPSKPHAAGLPTFFLRGVPGSWSVNWRIRDSPAVGPPPWSASTP